MNAIPRLIDLHSHWLLQYAAETTVYEPGLYDDARARLGQAEGYLQGAWAAVLSCSRHADDWARRADPWRALGDLIARVEAEFCGRLLMGPDDLARWRDDPDGLCWGVLGVSGLDPLVRTEADLDRLPGIFARGVRVFPMVGAGDNDLGRAFLPALADLGADRNDPRPILDLAGLVPTATDAVLDWFEADAARPGRVLLVSSHGAPLADRFTAARDSLRRFRALGGVVGFSVGATRYPTADALKADIEDAAALPFQGQPGFDGLALGTEFLAIDRTLPGLGNAGAVAAWVASTFDPPTAAALIQHNAHALLSRALGNDGRE